ncbi:MAG: hypothetical protein K2I75_01205 [Clostridiales bacterium]|nr:hypothetical protein [Clostridiales bacterium]
MRLNVNILCANEFALAIALTVFILLTVILSVLLIFLAASKNFRAVFFREKSRKKKSTKKQQSVSEPAPVMPHGGVDTIPIDPPKAARRTPTRKTAENDGTPEFLNAIPTVPLGGFPQAAPTPRGGKARQSMRIAEIPNDTEQGGAYVARSVTITRARSVTPTKSDNSEKDKTETAKPARTPKRDKK